MATGVKVGTPPDGEQLLGLYKLEVDMADKSLEVEREITVKNFTAFGAVLLVQNGFFLISLKLHVALAVSGVVLCMISAAARVMAILYSKYSDRLYMLAAITLTVYLKGADGLDIRKRRLAARNGPSAKDEVAPSAKGNLEERALPNADTISWREFCTYGGALAFINLIPGAIGLLMVCVAPFLWYFDPAPWWQLTNPPAANAVSATR